jgi:hypothetical protein
MDVNWVETKVMKSYLSNKDKSKKLLNIHLSSFKTTLVINEFSCNYMYIYMKESSKIGLLKS